MELGSQRLGDVEGMAVEQDCIGKEMEIWVCLVFFQPLPYSETYWWGSRKLYHFLCNARSINNKTSTMQNYGAKQNRPGIYDPDLGTRRQDSYSQMTSSRVF